MLSVTNALSEYNSLSHGQKPKSWSGLKSQESDEYSITSFTLR